MIASSSDTPNTREVLSSMIRPTRTGRRAVALAVATAVAALGGGCGSSSSNSSSSTSSGGAAKATSTASSDGGESITPYSGPEAKFPKAFPTPKKTGKKFTVGFLNPIAANESLGALQKAIQKTATQLGGRAIVKDDQLKVDKQVSDFGQLLAQKVDVIIAYPLDPKALGPSLKQAKAAGVPVVGIDVTADVKEPLPSTYGAQVLQGRDQEAYVQVQIMKQSKPQAKVGLIGIGSPVPALKFLLAREKFYLKQAGLTVVGEQDNPSDDAAGGQQAASGLLGKSADMDGVIGYNDPSALGAVAAGRANGRMLTAVGLNGGTDGIEGVKSGRLAGTAQNDSVGLGIQATYAAYSLAMKQGKIPKTVVRPVKVVTKQTVDSITSWGDQLAKLSG